MVANIALDLVLALVVIISVFFDLRQRRIPNWVTLPGLAAGLALQGVYGGTDGLLTAGGGAAIGVGVLALPFMLGWVGGGDLKLLAAVGALKGASFAFWTLGFAGLIGGVMALAWLVRTGNLANSLGYMFLVWRRSAGEKPAALMASLPFGPALGLGVLLALFKFWR